MVQVTTNQTNLIQIRLLPGQKPEITLPPDTSRVQARLQPLLQLGEVVTNELTNKRSTGVIRIQVHDEDPEIPCLRFDAPNGDLLGPPLIPDPYCLASHGYSQLIEEFEENNPLHPLE